MGCGAEINDLILEDQKVCIRGCEEFKYLGVKINKKDRQENVKNRINRGRGEQQCWIVYCGTDR